MAGPCAALATLLCQASYRVAPLPELCSRLRDERAAQPKHGAQQQRIKRTACTPSPNASFMPDRLRTHRTRKPRALLTFRALSNNYTPCVSPLVPYARSL